MKKTQDEGGGDKMQRCWNGDDEKCFGRALKWISGELCERPL